MKKTLLVAALALATAGGAAPSGQGRQFHFNGRVWESQAAFLGAGLRCGTRAPADAQLEDQGAGFS